jgi:hypothetical protein
MIYFRIVFLIFCYVNVPNMKRFPLFVLVQISNIVHGFWVVVIVNCVNE